MMSKFLITVGNISNRVGLNSVMFMVIQVMILFSVSKLINKRRLLIKGCVSINFLVSIVQHFQCGVYAETYQPV